MNIVIVTLCGIGFFCVGLLLKAGCLMDMSNDKNRRKAMTHFYLGLFGLVTCVVGVLILN